MDRISEDYDQLDTELGRLEESVDRQLDEVRRDQGHGSAHEGQELYDVVQLLADDNELEYMFDSIKGDDL